jgi:Uma2 family endonuclease
MNWEVAPPVPVPDSSLLIESDGIPLESHWHVLQIHLLIDSISYWFRFRDDFYAGGNMFIYFSEEQARNRDYRGPDFFYVNGVNRWPLRRYWAVWLEGGRYPDLIIELLSPTTAEMDRTIKKALYEKTFHTHEYVCYDPDTEQLQGWRLNARSRYRTIRLDSRGRLWLDELQMWLGTWRGKYQGADMAWLRFFDDQGNLVLTADEAEAARAEREQIRAEAERVRAEAEKARAEAEKARAEAEKARAEAAEQEIARLRERLAEVDRPHTNPEE